jgi:hypothetical protein
MMIIKHGMSTYQRTVSSYRAVSRMTVSPKQCIQSWGKNLNRSENGGHSPAWCAYREYSRSGLD